MQDLFWVLTMHKKDSVVDNNLQVCLVYNHVKSGFSEKNLRRNKIEANSC